MRLLFVKLKHIGDALLLTPTLTAVKAAHPDAEIWVVTRAGCEDVLSGCPAIHRVVTSAAPETSNRSSSTWLHGVRMLQDLRRQKFDYAFELGEGDRGRWLTVLSGARVRGLTAAVPLSWWWRKLFNAFSPTGKLHWRHRVERDYVVVRDILALGDAAIPPLSFDRSRTQPWEPAHELKDFILIHPGTRWKRKRWPVEKWIELSQRLLKQVPKIVISAGPDPEELQAASEIETALGGRALNSAGQLNWPQLAGLLYRAKLFVGVDTAAMHLAAACQTPSVALFGPSLEYQWRPWSAPHIIVTRDTKADSPETTPEAAEPEKRTVEEISVEQTYAACQHFLQRPLPGRA